MTTDPKIAEIKARLEIYDSSFGNHRDIEDKFLILRLYAANDIRYLMEQNESLIKERNIERSAVNSLVDNLRSLSNNIWRRDDIEKVKKAVGEITETAINHLTAIAALQNADAVAVETDTVTLTDARLLHGVEWK